MPCELPATMTNIPFFIEATATKVLVSDPKKLAEWWETSNAVKNQALYGDKRFAALNVIRGQKALIRGNSIKLILEVCSIIHKTFHRDLKKISNSKCVRALDGD